MLPLAVAGRSVLARSERQTTLTRFAAIGCLDLRPCVRRHLRRLRSVQRWYLSRHPERGATLLANHTSHISLADTTEPLTAPGIPTWLSRLPGNQVLNICVQEKELAIPRLAPQHDGLRIAHLTDLHMSGRITRAFFEQVVDEVNRTSADIVAITGDIVEGNRFLDWIPTHSAACELAAAFTTCSATTTAASTKRNSGPRSATRA